MDIQVNGRKVLRYHHAPVLPPAGLDPKYTRSAFIHPLWTTKGQVLTDSHVSDHPHHMGLWMPWTDCEFQGRKVSCWDLLNGGGTIRFVKYDSTTKGPVYGGFVAQQEHVFLKAPGGEKVILDETWNVRVYNLGGAEKGYWLGDFVSTQRCATESPVLVKKFRFGGMSFRGRGDWENENCDYLTSEGIGREKANGTRPRWCDMAGECGPDWAGVTIMGHPKNFRHPEPIRIWAKGHVYFCFAPHQIGDFSIEPGKDYVFRYRFYVHEGKINVADTERIWYDYAEPPVVTIEKR